MNIDLKYHRNGYDYWNKTVCCSKEAGGEPLTSEYFAAMEEYKYSQEPEIQAFAQFSRYHGKKVLEAGVGAGTDFLQWVRCGARAYGIDLTESAIIQTSERLKIYGLQAEELQQADCENLPYPDNSFDLVYSWGVIHHTPSPKKALSELVRVTKPGGELKVMVYNRHSLVAFYRWWQMALLKLRPWMSLKNVLANHMENKGTQAFTEKEIKELFESFPLEIQNLQKFLTCYDRKVPFSGLWTRIAGADNAGWFMGVKAVKNK
jgi:ubiquinone/menaquinone biosynthesis C-methylase UbiE